MSNMSHGMARLMKRNKADLKGRLWVALRRVVSALAALLFATSAHGAPRSAPALPDLVQEADTICVGVPILCKEVGRRWFYTGTVDEKGEEIHVLINQAVASFNVETVLKGVINQKQIQVAFPVNVTGEEPVLSEPPGAVGSSRDINPGLFTELVPKEHVMVFLRSGTDKSPFSLLAPESQPGPKVRISQAMPVHPLAELTLAELTPLRKVLLYLAEALAASDNSTQVECLRRLEEVGTLLYYPPQEMAKTREGLGELPAGWIEAKALYKPVLAPPKAGQLPGQLREWRDPPADKIRQAYLQLPDPLEKFVEHHVVPAVLKLAQSTDLQVREQAVVTAAALQQAAVIPELVRGYTSYLSEIKKNPQKVIAYLGWLSLLEGYRIPAATEYLVNLLHNDRPAVRRAAARALGRIEDSRALPFLIANVDDTDPAAQEAILGALSAITREDVFTGSSGSKAERRKQAVERRKQAVAFWKQWSIEHKTQLDALKAQQNPWK
jgi:hypothetical protein